MKRYFRDLEEEELEEDLETGRPRREAKDKGVQRFCGKGDV